MAIYLPFRKVREDRQEVEYTYGHPTMDRHLVIEVGTREARPLDGTVDRSYAAVLRKILQGREILGHWPESGAHAA